MLQKIILFKNLLYKILFYQSFKLKLVIKNIIKKLFIVLINFHIIKQLHQ